MNTNDLIAIDVHVHLETEIEDNEANAAAQKYFGQSGGGRNRHARRSRWWGNGVG